MFNIKIKAETESFVTEEYGTFGWPIKYFDKAQNLNEEYNYTSFNLRIDDNTKPILFIENTDLLIENNASRFLDDKKLLNGSSTDWSNEITLKFPTIVSEYVKENVSYYLKINYFRQEYNESSPNTVIKNEFYFNNAFAPIDLQNITETDYLFQHSINSELNFTKGFLPNMTNDFSYVAENGAQWDANRIVFYNKASFKKKSTGSFFDSTTNSYSNLGFNLEGDFNKMSFLSNDIQINKNTIQEVVSAGVYQTINIIDIIKNNGFPNTYEDLLCLGITQAEFTTLKNLTGFTNKHHRYIYIQEITGSPFEDKDEKRFRKFELKVQGLNSEGNRLIVAPAPPIYVYTQNGLVFTTKNFAEQEISQQSVTYQRNYEEKIGLNINPNTTKTYEDYFIGDINPNMKVEVDGFINTLAAIPNDSNAFASIRTLVEDSAKDIWDEAVRYVQVNVNTTPDDRPLYWARIKMQVALKSHLYFIGQHTYSSDIQGSEVNSGSDLEKIIQIFEEKSRNYKGVDFSSNNSAFITAYQQNPNLKKVLISGYDPFFLNEKQFPEWQHFNQNNPSGAVALSLHNVIVYDNSNFPIGIIQSIVLPVRYRDFNLGIIEDTFSQFFNLINNKANIILTISLDPNTSTEFYIERFAARNRGGTIDNEGVSNETKNTFIQIKSNVDGNQFYETKLPFVPIIYNQTQKGNPFTVGLRQDFNDLNSIYTTSVNSANDDPDNYKQPLNLTSGLISKSGSGGSYLSNEIFYRVSRLREKLDKNLPTGHLHIPEVPIAHVGSVSKKVREIIKNALLFVILLFIFNNTSFCQVESKCFFRAFSDNGKIITAQDNLFKIDFIPLSIDTVEFRTLKQNKLENSIIYDSIKCIFSSIITVSGNEFLIIINKRNNEKEMKIRVLMNAGFKNYQFDSIPFLEGFYEINVNKILNKKYKGRYVEEENERKKWDYSNERKSLSPIPNLWDITPQHWKDVKKY